MSEQLEWKLSPRLVNYFASSIYGQNFGIVAARELLQNALDSKASVFRPNLSPSLFLYFNSRLLNLS